MKPTTRPSASHTQVSAFGRWTLRISRRSDSRNVALRNGWAKTLAAAQTLRTSSQSSDRYFLITVSPHVLVMSSRRRTAAMGGSVPCRVSLPPFELKPLLHVIQHVLPPLLYRVVHPIPMLA